MVDNTPPGPLRMQVQGLSDANRVHAVGTRAQALQACAELGPFAVAVVRDRPRELDAVELFERLARNWPDTSRILVADELGEQLALRALHRARVFRLLRTPVEGDEACARELAAAIEGGAQLFRRVQEERLVVEQLRFSRESLLSLTGTLDRRLEDQLGRGHVVERLVSELAGAGSLGEIAALVVGCCASFLGERGVRVELYAVHGSQGVVRATPAQPVAPFQVCVIGSSMDGSGTEVGRLVVEERDRFGRSLSEADRLLLETIRSAVALAARSHVSSHERELAQHATVFALARLAENRDDDTGKHLERVSRYCRLVAEGLRADGHHSAQLDDAFIDDLVRSAPLHDIGKVGIPDSILLKPGALTEEEWQVMKRHTVIGAETLEHVQAVSGESSFLRTAHEIAGSHHEKWDGSGYPRGLAGANIPLSARIMALADCYDALTTWRPYKDPWSHAEALALILEERGRHFDPQVVDAFHARADAADRIRDQLADSTDDGSRKVVA